MFHNYTWQNPVQDSYLKFLKFCKVLSDFCEILQNFKNFSKGVPSGKSQRTLHKLKVLLEALRNCSAYVFVILARGLAGWEIRLEVRSLNILCKDSLESTFLELTDSIRFQWTVFIKIILRNVSNSDHLAVELRWTSDTFVYLNTLGAQALSVHHPQPDVTALSCTFRADSLYALRWNTKSCNSLKEFSDRSGD